MKLRQVAGCISAAVFAIGGVAEAQILQGGGLAPSLSEFAATPKPALSTDIREGVAAVVNNEVISTYDLRQRTLLLIVTSGVQPTQDNLPQLQKEALRDLVDEHLQMQEIRRIQTKQKVKVEPTEAEIETDLSSLAQQNGLQKQQLVASLTSAGVDPSTLREQLRAEISWRRYVGGRFGSSVSIGNDQINAALKRMNASAAKPQYLLGEIFIDAQRVGGQETAENGARQLIDQIQKGAPFTAVARQFSADPTGANGGDAGWQTADDLAPPLVAALEQLRPGQLSQPVPMPGGVYILLLREKRAGSDTTLVSLKQAAIRLANDAPETEVEAARKKLESLRGEVKSCADLEPRAGKMQGVVAGDLGEADVKDLAPAFRDAIQSLNEGQVSAPVRTAAGLHLVALCGKRAGGAQQINREDVENRLYEQQLAMIAQRELRDLRNSANVESR